MASILADPVRFIENPIGYTLSDTQKQIARAVPRHSRVAVKGCHASGKSFIAASMLLWWLHRYDNARVLVVAPSFRQVNQVIWTEVHLAAQRMTLPAGAKLLQTELRFSDSCYAIGLTATNHSAFAGYHGQNILVIADEATGIDQDIYRGIDGVLAGGNSHHLLLGNPTISSGVFFEAFTKHRAAWKLFTINALESPNMKDASLEQLLKMSDKELDDNPFPFLTTKRWIRDRYREWFNGSLDQSPLWASRVLGEFPAQSEFALYWLSWIEAASRKYENEVESVTAGLDPSGPGKDESAICIVSNGAILETFATTVADSRGQVVNFLNRWRDRLRLVRVDEGGVGYHLVSHLRDQGFVVEGVNFGASAREPERYANLKAALYWRLREELEAGRISGMTDPVLQEQCASIVYDLDGAGRIQIESKEAMRKRGIRSPDRLEGLLLALPDATRWTASDLGLIPRASETVFDARLASGKSASGFTMSEIERKDAEEDASAKFRSSTYLRRTKRGRFFSVGF